MAVRPLKLHWPHTTPSRLAKPSHCRSRNLDLSGQPLPIRIKRVDPALPLPKHETRGSVGFNLLCREPVTVPPGEIRLIPANIIVAVPEGFMLMVASRSSLAIKKGLMLANSVGIIDQDYRGANDEVMVQVYNMKDQPVDVERGERLAQGIFVRIAQVEWEEVSQMDDSSRGGFGSTG